MYKFIEGKEGGEEDKGIRKRSKDIKRERNGENEL